MSYTTQLRNRLLSIRVPAPCVEIVSRRQPLGPCVKIISLRERCARLGISLVSRASS